MNCLLCQSSHTLSFAVEKNPAHSYFHCNHCDVIFMDPVERPLPEQEKSRYDQHQNEDSKGYRRFYEPLIQDIQNFTLMLAKPASEVSLLDYGCGPGAFLGALLEEQGYRPANYDPFYKPDAGLLNRKYDVITSTEVWEHLYDPAREIRDLCRRLNPFGLLAVMTAAHPGVSHFHDWHYRRDFTHVVFYSTETMKWIADRYQLSLIRAQSPYWIFQKKGS